MKRYLLITSLSAALLLSFTAVVVKAKDGQQVQQINSANAKIPIHQMVDRMTIQSRKGSDEATGSALDMMFALVGAPPEITSSDEVKTRIVRAEAAFRARTQPPITEGTIVSSINKLAAKYGMPDYVRTNAEEVRLQHFRLMTIFPNMMAKAPGKNREGENPHLGLHTQLSPLEAVTLTSVLLRQKVLNPEFQQTTEEKEQKRELPTGRANEVVSRFALSGRTNPSQIGSDVSALLDDLGIQKLDSASSGVAK